MNRVQNYIFTRVGVSVLVIIGGLVLLAILAQGLSRTDIIVENRQGAATFFFVVALGIPQIMALLAPMSIFVAGVWALNRLHRDSELVVAEAAGMTRWQLASPIIRIAMLGAVIHLGVNLWGQPTAQRAMRETVEAARADLASSLVRPGQFTSPDENLTVFARDQIGSDLVGVQIAERAGKSDARDFLAQRGRFIEVSGRPAIVMFNGEVHQRDENGNLNILNFDQSTFDLSPFLKEQSRVVYKASDRYLHELLYIDRSDYNESRSADEFYAEVHTRLTTPMLSIAMALLAIIAVLGGNFSRHGYTRRIMTCSGAALGVTMLQLAAQSASVGDRSLNALQWFVPIAAIAIMAYLIFYRGQRIKGAKR